MRTIDPEIPALATGIFIDIAAAHLGGRVYPMSRIPTHFGVPTSTASRNVAYLSNHLVRRDRTDRTGIGLILQQPSPDDRRAVNLILTARGKTLAEQLFKAIT
jgi:DNA-binding MarR family transcriptional regulator